MADDGVLSARDFGSAFKGFLDAAVSAAPAEEPFFVRRLTEHLGSSPATLPVVVQEFPLPERPNLQIALDAYLAKPTRSAEVIGISDPRDRYGGITLSGLSTPGLPGMAPPSQGPVDHLTVTLDGGRTLSCLSAGLLLVSDGDLHRAMLIRGGRSPFQEFGVEVMAEDRAGAESVLAELRREMNRRSVYRGKVLSLSIDPHNRVQVQFHRLPAVDRQDIVMPEEILARIERHTIAFARHGARLLAAGRHLKRGLLFHGPPGTGKTLTAMHLAGRMEGRTVLLIVGRGMRLIEHACGMARLLQPAMVILEDVDLVAEERTQEGACTPLLFELLNQMDGLADDADIVFLLTTNRADLLEPALAARPGRIDQAIEIPLPDADCRRRLLELYGRGLELRVDGLDSLVSRTEGVSAAFIRELLRKAALLAADESEDQGPLAVTDRHLDDALAELVVAGGVLTQRLLGAAAPRVP